MELGVRVTLHHVIAAWLRAELCSPCFRDYLQTDDSDLRIIKDPDVTNADENIRRRQLIAYRGGIIEDIANSTEWREATRGVDDLAGLFASPYPSWELFSGCTGKIIRVAEAVRNGVRLRVCDRAVQQSLDEISKHVGEIYAGLGGESVRGRLILLARSLLGPYTVIEGTKRATALCWRHCLETVPCYGTPAFVGITARPSPFLSPHGSSET